MGPCRAWGDTGNVAGGVVVNHVVRPVIRGVPGVCIRGCMVCGWPCVCGNGGGNRAGAVVGMWVGGVSCSVCAGMLCMWHCGHLRV